MDSALQLETDKLLRSWTRYDPAILRDYLVADVEDPRINLQSILSRHFLIRAFSGGAFADLMLEECRFSGLMNGLLRFAGQLHDPDDAACVLYALEHGSDNAEGIEIPAHIVAAFKILSNRADDAAAPNYIREFFATLQFTAGKSHPAETVMDTFASLWARALSQSPPGPEKNPTVLEPACGSANDYRFLSRYGIADRIRYTGFDLCPGNIENARTLFPGAHFQTGNVFQIDACNLAYELCYLHDLFEHLSPQGLERAIEELCRVTRGGICANFFRMDETREHEIQPVEDYHWNKLSMGRVRESFSSHGFDSRVLHIATFLKQQTGSEEAHNPNAYTFILWRR